METKTGLAGDVGGETLLERAVKRQLVRLNEAEKRRRAKARESYRQWRADVLAKA